MMGPPFTAAAAATTCCSLEYSDCVQEYSLYLNVCYLSSLSVLYSYM
jgi:hypothetical protein